MSYLSMTNVGSMKKPVTAKKKAALKQKELPAVFEEPLTAYYKQLKVMPLTKEYSYADFKKLADKTPFTQQEWAAMLHLSERTLQRYAKTNAVFAPINAERAQQIAKVLQEGKQTFGKLDNFYNWLKREPFMLEGNLSLQSLTSYDGINKILTQLGRIQHGNFA
ncbi:MAG: hypothetical protein JWQ27_3030 [Ferruginibacter sp.]|nr:hypothetical protein [Ferruginibacter sp.]